MMVRKESSYRYDGAITDLQRNVHLHPDKKPNEEFMLASLLWDIADDDKEKGDYFAHGSKAVWGILNQPSIKTVRDLYEALAVRYKTQDTDKTDGLSDLDALFVLHGFFADKNGNGKYDAGEAVGYADSWPVRKATKPQSAFGKPARRSYEPFPGTLLGIEVVGPQGETIKAPSFLAQIIHTDGTREKAYSLSPSNARNSALRIAISADAAIEIRPTVPGYVGDVFRLDFAEFSRAVIAANVAGKKTFGRHRFELRDAGIPQPRNLRAELREDAVHLSWASDLPVRVLRSMTGTLANAHDGVVVSENARNSLVDLDALDLTGVPLTYFAFAVGPNGALSKPVTVALQANDDFAPYTDPWRPWWIIVLASVVFLLILAVGFALARRRRAVGS